MTFAHDHWMQEALRVAGQALPQDVPVGAIVVDADDQVIGYGCNRRERDGDPLGHAEIAALQMAAHRLGNWRLINCTLYVTLEPCPMCASALYQARLERLVFGAADPVQGAITSAYSMGQLYRHRMHVIGGISEAACQAALQAFFKNRRLRI